MSLLQNIFTTFNFLKKDKMILFLALVPIIIGCIFYWFFASWLYGDLFSFLSLKINLFMHLDSFNIFVKYILGILLTIVLFFIINWTFVLIISILASPFNDFLSERIERIYLKQELSITTQIKGKLNKIIFIIFNEAKKITIIILLNLVAFLFSWIPFLLPLSILFSSILLSVNFLDYSWSRHNLNYKECIKSYKMSWFKNTTMGAILFIFVSIPFVNLMLIPFSVIFYTLIFLEKHDELK